jgi:hypothetical protein
MTPSPLFTTILFLLVLLACTATMTTPTKLRPRRALLSTTKKPVSRQTWGAAKKLTNKVVDTVTDTTKDVVDTVTDTTKDVVDTVTDTTKDVVHKTKELVDSVVDCVSNPLECEELNPFWDLVPDCLMRGEPHKCVDLESAAEDVGKYAARLQKISSVAMYEVGGILLRIAREARDRRFEDCDERSDTTPTPIPIGFDFKRTAPFVNVDYWQAPSCHMPGEWLEDVFNTFKDCFMSDLNTLGPKVVSAWKDEELFSEGVCEPEDHFAIILKLKLVVDAGKGVTGSLGGGVGLAIGCNHGVMKVEMVFDYEAGVKISVVPVPLSITLNQNVGFLKTWPTHHDEFLNDIGNLRLTLGMPKMAKFYMQIALNLVCQYALPDAVSDILCYKALPQTVSVFIEPPKFDLNIDKPMLTGFKMAGMSLGWSMELYEPAPGAKGVKSASKTGAVAIKSVKNNNPAKKPDSLLKGSPSLAFHYGNTHIFGDIPDTSPCKGWPQYDDCQDDPCQNGGICKDLLDSFECTCSGSFTGITCEVAPTTTTTASSPTVTEVETEDAVTTKAPASGTNDAEGEAQPPVKQRNPDTVVTSNEADVSSEVGGIDDQVASDGGGAGTGSSNADKPLLSQPMLIGVAVVGSLVGVAMVALAVSSLCHAGGDEATSTKELKQPAVGNVIVENPLNSTDEVAITKHAASVRRRSSVSQKV